MTHLGQHRLSLSGKRYSLSQHLILAIEGWTLKTLHYDIQDKIVELKTQRRSNTQSVKQHSLTTLW